MSGSLDGNDRSLETLCSAPATLFLPQWPMTSSSQRPLPASIRPIAPATSIVAMQAIDVSTVKSPLIPQPQSTQPNVRRLLTHDDKRRICEYYNENPTLKHAKIGGTCINALPS